MKVKLAELLGITAINEVDTRTYHFENAWGERVIPVERNIWAYWRRERDGEYDSFHNMVQSEKVNPDLAWTMDDDNPDAREIVFEVSDES